MDLKEFDRSAQELRLLNLLVWKDGKEILRRDYDGEIRRNQYSASKSFTSAAVGIAQRAAAHSGPGDEDADCRASLRLARNDTARRLPIIGRGTWAPPYRIFRKS